MFRSRLLVIVLAVVTLAIAAALFTFRTHHHQKLDPYLPGR